MVYIANPIYDTVFKYLLEDERIVKTLLSALLKKEVLSVFDQTRKDKKNHQVMDIDETVYEHDAEMMRIVHRLLAAASDAKLRQDMNVEDEYFRAIENRDTAIMLRDQRIEEQNKQIEEQDKLIKEKDEVIKEKDEVIRSSARLLKQAGVPLSQIQQMSGFSEEEIIRL